MLFRGADRVLASAIMGFVLSYSRTQIFSYVEGTTFFWVLAGVFAVLWYVVDVLAFPQLIKVAAKIEEEVAAEMVAEETASSIDYEYESPEQLEKRLKKEERQKEKQKWRERKKNGGGSRRTTNKNRSAGGGKKRTVGNAPFHIKTIGALWADGFFFPLFVS